MEKNKITSDTRQLLHVVLFGISMGYFEAAVVIYLRELYYPEGFHFPLRIISDHIGLVEVGREAASLVMLAAVALLAARTFYERFCMFAIAFAVWDLVYYVVLKVFLGWPESVFTPDLLFLIPLPWVGPVLAPLLVSVSLITGSVLILRRIWSGGRFEPNWREWSIAVGGAFLIFLSFIVDTSAGRGLSYPAPYRWEFLVVGLAAGFYALGRSLIRTAGEDTVE